MICDIDGRVLGRMQFGVLVQVVCLGCCLIFARLTAGSGCLGGAVWGALWRAHFCEIDGRVHWGI